MFLNMSLRLLLEEHGGKLFSKRLSFRNQVFQEILSNCFFPKKNNNKKTQTKTQRNSQRSASFYFK